MTDLLCSPLLASPEGDSFFRARADFVDPFHVVAMSGDLDLASREAAVRACLAADHLHVIVDLAELDFMDCGGYRALIIARSALEGRGGSLSWRDQRGEPERLLDLLDEP